MRTSLVAPIYSLEKKLDPVFQGKYWEFKLVIIALLVSAGTLLAFNSIFIDVGFRSLYKEIKSPGSEAGLFWDDIVNQGREPLKKKVYLVGKPHESNRTFRLTVPMISRVLHFGIAKLYLLHVIAGLALLWIMTSLVNGILDNKILTFYFITGFASIYAGANFYINYLGHADAFAFFFMVLLVYFRHPVLVLVFSQLAFWCDERALVNTSWVLLLLILPFIDFYIKEAKLNWKLLPSAFYTLLFSGVLYLGIRKWMEIRLGLSVGQDMALSIDSTIWSLKIIGDKGTRALEGMWLILLAVPVILIQSKQWTKLVLFGGCLLITLMTVLIVADGTRAASYGFVAFLVALKILNDTMVKKEFRYLLLVSALVSLMFPMSFP